MLSRLLFRVCLAGAVVSIAALDFAKPGYFKFGSPLDLMPWRDGDSFLQSQILDRDCSRGKALSVPLPASSLIRRAIEVDNETQFRRRFGAPLCENKEKGTATWDLSKLFGDGYLVRLSLNQGQVTMMEILKK
jgi:hypothetical protein